VSAAGIYWELLRGEGSIRSRRARYRRWRRREESRVGRMLAAASTADEVAQARSLARALAIFFDGATPDSGLATPAIGGGK
jgi:hypothetical protein